MKKTIIIIGGGIAGLSSAYFLSQQGFQIKILEREKNKDIDKICTSVVNPKTLTTLSQMGLLKYLLDYDFLHIDGIKGLSYDNTEFQGFYNQTYPYLNFGYTIPRSKLSKNMHHLIKDLEDVEYFNDWEVQNTISKNNFVIGVEGIDHGKSKKIFGDLIIDASGRNSVILKKNNMIESLKNHKRYAIICQYKNVDFSDNLFSIGTHYYIEPGYFCIFPIDQNNVILAFILSENLWRKAKENTENWIDDFIHRSDFKWSHWFDNSIRTTKVVKFGPLGFEVKKKVIKGVLPVGDTNGFYDPLTGEGIGYAIDSSLEASKIAKQLLTSDENWVEIQKDLLFNLHAMKEESNNHLYNMHKLLKNPLLYNRFIQYLSNNQRAANWSACAFANMLPKGQRNTNELMRHFNKGEV